MAEKLTPPSKKVSRGDGLKNGSANSTMTTPNHTDFKVWKKEGSGKEKMF